MRKFTCPFCGFVHVFTPKGKEKWPKKVRGFTCPRCGKKATGKEGRKDKQPKARKPSEKAPARPKPRKPRRDLPPLDTAPIEWRTRNPPYAPPSGAGHPGARAGGRGGYEYHPRQPQAPRPTDRALGDAVLVGSGIRPSGPIPRLGFGRSGPKLENRRGAESLGPIVEKLEAQGRKLAGIMVTMSGIEKRVDEKAAEMDARLKDLDSKLLALSALLSRMEDILSHYKQRGAGRR